MKGFGCSRKYGNMKGLGVVGSKGIAGYRV